jgi:hypothetical protein
MMRDINKITGDNPFKVPENYFREVNDKILASTSGKKNQTAKHGLIASVRPYLAVAASVAVIAILSYTGIKVFRQSERPVSISEIPVEEYSEMILNDIDIITLEEDVLKSGITSEIPDIDKETIIDYLEFENIDISLINDQL